MPLSREEGALHAVYSGLEWKSVKVSDSTKVELKKPVFRNTVPDQPDPRGFWPPGSGSTSQRYGSGSGFGSGSFYNHGKIIRKTLNPTIL
jgi:hypothetical protein